MGDETLAYHYNDTALEISSSKKGDKKINDEIELYDHLGTNSYAKALKQFVLDCETPMTIGIQGDWGLGKTSLLNMIKAYLRGNIWRSTPRSGKGVGIVWFNTWHYSLFGQEEFLGISVIKGLLEQIKTEFEIKDSDNKFKDLVDKVGNVLKHAQFSALGFGLKVSDAADSKNSPDNGVEYNDISSVMLRFKDSFQDLIQTVIEQKSLDRIVFFIDDLDRVKPSKALELLESIKNFMDVKNCVFLLAVDYEVVQIGMAEKLGQDLQKLSGKSFFDKIIQLPFTMPSTSYKLGNYIQKLLSESKNFTVSDKDREFYEEVTSCTVGRNPRSIKRVINYANLIKLIRGDTPESISDEKGTRIQGQKILYALLCMQVAWPEIFAHFVKSPTPATIKNIEDWDYLDAIPFINKLYDRTPNVDQLRSNISAYFDLFYDLLDVNNDGKIDSEELKPVHYILSISKLSPEAEFREPIDIFLNFVANNDSGSKYSLINIMFKASKWCTSGKVDFRMSGTRYMTIIINRKQVGSLVTLKRNPFIFRLAIDDLEKFDEFIREAFIKSYEVEKMVGSLEDVNLTGFGDVKIDLDYFVKLKEKEMLEVFDKLYEYMRSNFK